MYIHFFLALIPILFLIIALSIIKMQGYKACLTALALTAIEAILFWKLPVQNVALAGLEGVLNALWPICLVILAALFMYNVTLESGAMNTIKNLFTKVSDDKRILMLIIAWGFGTFMEGMAGFGTAVAIPASMLVALGFEALPAVTACLLINSTPTVFGSVGVPCVTMASITGLDGLSLSSATAILQIILTSLSPFIAVCIIGKSIKALKGVFLHVIIASFSLVIPQFLSAKYLGPELPDIAGSIFCMIVLVILSKIIPHKTPSEFLIQQDSSSQTGETKFSKKQAIIAWLPFILTFIFLLLTSNLVQPVHNVLSSVKSTIRVYKGENANSLTFYWINTPGVLIFIAAFIGGLFQKLSPKKQFLVLTKTCKTNIRTFITICSVLALAKIMTYSGMISNIATVLVNLTGSYFPIISPFIGVIGGFVTGSGTSTSVLFGPLQKETALAIGIKAQWLCAANMMGAGIGKMICPQSLAIGSSATGLSGKESAVLQKVFPYCILYAIIAGIFSFVFSH